MSLATFTVLMMSLGMIVQERGRQMADGTMYGTIASLEAQRATEFGLLICILTAPWLILAAFLLS